MVVVKVVVVEVRKLGVGFPNASGTEAPGNKRGDMSLDLVDWRIASREGVQLIDSVKSPNIRVYTIRDK